MKKQPEQNNLESPVGKINNLQQMPKSFKIYSSFCTRSQVCVAFGVGLLLIEALIYGVEDECSALYLYYSLYQNPNIQLLIEIFLIVLAECGDYVAEDYPDHRYLSSYKFVPNQDQELERRIMENHKKHA